MKTWKCVIEFKTCDVLSQEISMVFWQRGDDFHSSGRQQYEWTATVDASDLDAAIAHMRNGVIRITDHAGLDFPPQFVGIKVKQEEPSETTPDRAPEAADSV